MILWMLACGGPSDSSTFEGGDYEVATVAMVDNCLDGALEALFMPQGRDTPQVFEFPATWIACRRPSGGSCPT